MGLVRIVSGDLPALYDTITRLFAGIPWRNFTGNDIIDYEDYERYYASVLYAFFAAINCTIIPEDVTNHGQTDLTVRLENRIYVMEIKVVTGPLPEGSPNNALEQIRKRKYSEKYLNVNDTHVYGLGLVFSRKERNLV